MSDVVVTRSKGAHLPNETWLEILSYSPDYLSCVRAMRVCKTFQAIIKMRQFDGPLFRLAPSATPLKPGNRIELHPLIGAVQNLATCHQNVVIRCGCCTQSYHDLGKVIRAINDFATSPAVKEIVIDFRHPIPTVTVNNDAGVTVKEVIRGYCQLWSARPHAPWRDDEGFEFGTWLEAMMDHNGFNGFDPLKIKKNGAVVLGADSNNFDS